MSSQQQQDDAHVELESQIILRLPEVSFFIINTFKQ